MNKVMRLVFFKFIFDKMLTGNNRVIIQRYLARETLVQGHYLPAYSRNKEAGMMWVEGWGKGEQEEGKDGNDDLAGFPGLGG